LNQTIQLPKLSQKQWLTLAGSAIMLLFLNQFIEQILNRQMSEAMQNESSAFVIVAMALFLNGVTIVWLQAVVLTSLIQNHHPETAEATSAIKIGDFSREWLRSMGNASLWMFAFIIPGLLRWVDYSLLPFVCFFDPAYQRGELDALERCRQLAKGIRGRLWGLWLGFGLFIPLILTGLFGDYESFFETPVSATGLIIVDATLQTIAFVLLWKLYWRARHDMAKVTVPSDQPPGQSQEAQP
jgi:hypothetical protein